MTSIWFITPAYRRYPISRICLAQHRWALDKIRKAGFWAEQVVVSDDLNLKIATEMGAWRRVCDNKLLGRKFNLGIRFAASMGATHVVPLGSDTFLDPEFLLGGILFDSVLATGNYSMVREDGAQRADLQMSYTTYCLPVKRINVEEACDPTINRGCDTSMLERAGLDLEVHPAHPLEVVSFRTAKSQVSDYDAYFDMWGLAKTDRPFNGLDHFYPKDIVAEITTHYKEIQCMSSS